MRVIFEKIISPYAKAPKNYGIIDDNSFIPLDCNSVIPQKYNLCNSVKHLLEIYKMVVIKPVKGALGWGLYFIKYNDGEGYLEGNNHPNDRINQIHRPLLLDPRVVGFFRMHGLI